MGDTLRRGLTARQLFHVLLATSLCDGREPEAQERVNQPLRNSQEFATLWTARLARHEPASQVHALERCAAEAINAPCFVPQLGI
ncbi:hypothetical protein HPB52_010831 [Rhipicephalus sanguineus]|uniref:Uncharacterized protein n=1 Tax=Rhipicephalus sanguineus TaxID=34632 RepID=A0A9D4Q9L7_RHISA|nr:hypothetical protein HPB52_010831 [Rhipicephalus sanguineus]